MLSKLDVTTGIAGFLLANGALNADGIEGEIRQKLLENDKVEAIIVLPRDMFYTTDISVTLWIINNNKKACNVNGRQLRDRQKKFYLWIYDVGMIILSNTQLKKAQRRKTVLTDEQIVKVKSIYQSWQEGNGYEDVPELYKAATLEDIRNANYSLAPSKYVEFIDHDLEIDYDKEMARIQAEMKEILNVEKASQVSLEEAFRGLAMKYKLGQLIEQVERRNSELEFGADAVRGISNTKQIQMTKADISNRSFKKFQIVKDREFVYNRRTTRMGEKSG